MSVDLPPFKLWLDKATADTDSGWVSGWKADKTELLGGERAVFYWLHVYRQRSRVEAIRLTKLYWKVRDEGGCAPGKSFDINDVPAGLRRDVAPHVWMFVALSQATWCEECRTCPALVGTMCAWCALALVSAA